MFQYREHLPPRKGRVFLDKSRKNSAFYFFSKGEKREVPLSETHRSDSPVLQWWDSHAGLDPATSPSGPMERGGASQLDTHLFSSTLRALLVFMTLSLPVSIANFLNYISDPTSVINTFSTLFFLKEKYLYWKNVAKIERNKTECMNYVWKNTPLANSSLPSPALTSDSCQMFLLLQGVWYWVWDFSKGGGESVSWK